MPSSSENQFLKNSFLSSYRFDILKSFANIYFFFEKQEILLLFSPLYTLKEERRGEIKLASKKICENF